MGRMENRAKFKTCDHDWELHVDVDNTGGPATGNTVFLCTKCKTIITMLEKNSLDSFLAQKELLKIQEQNAKDSLAAQIKSQKIQERSVKISMWANIIATLTVLVAFLVLLFGEGLLANNSIAYTLEKGNSDFVIPGHNSLTG